MANIDAVIVDVEGVVRDSRNAFHHAYEYALSSVNLKLNAFPVETWKLRGYKELNSQKKILEALYALSKTNDDITKVFWKKKPVDYVTELMKKAQPNRETMEKLEESYVRYITTPSIMRRIPPVRAGKMGVKLLKEDGYVVAALTNSSRKISEKWMELKKIETKFDNLMGIEDVGMPKPSPDGIIKMCKALKVKPKSAIYVGDTEADIIAAKSAGVIPIGVISGGSERRTLRDLGATYIFKSVTELALWMRNGGKVQD